MSRACVRALLTSLLVAAAPVIAAGQGSAPRPDRDQRAALERLVAGVDAAAAGSLAPAEATWQIHVLRASDGSHYVATSLLARSGISREGPVTLYVRLATRQDVPPLVTDRSAVGEWLRGMRSDPLPQRAGRVVSVPLGEMPVGGASSIDRAGASQSSAVLALQDRQRARAREEQEEREKQRRAELEGTSRGAGEREGLHPFEDFAFETPITILADATPVLRRSIVAGPGAYDLFVAVAEPGDRRRPGAVHVYRHRLDLPAASTGSLRLSGIVLGNSVETLETPYPPESQASHPYAFGSVEIVPDPDEVFATDERLAFAVQVVNPRSTPTGKPNVSVNFRVLRTTVAGEQQVATLTPQAYNDATLPVDFSVEKGHPLIAATVFPLQSLARGSYRLQITAADRAAGTSATASATFRIVGTPRSLLAEAPPGPPFSRGAMLSAPILDTLLAALRPAVPSAGLASLIEAASAARFADALRDETVSPAEEGVKVALRGLALLALADSRAAASQLLRARQMEVPAGPVLLMLGACRALEGNDREALALWEASRAAGLETAATLALITDAHLRMRNGREALESIGRVRADEAGAQRWTLARAQALIHAAREDEALRVLATAGGSGGTEAGAEFLLIQALFAGHVHGRGAGRTPEGLKELKSAGERYASSEAAHAALVRDWLAAVATSSSAR